MARSLNKVQLIGNLTRDPELRYTPSGAAVCTFSLATNRSWTAETGEKHEEADFHNIVAWSKLAEICSQLLVKGRKVYVEGRLSTRSWTSQDGQPKSRTEVVIEEMILLDSKGSSAMPGSSEDSSETEPAAKPTRKAATKEVAETPEPESTPTKSESTPIQSGSTDEEIAPEDIPF